MAEHQRVPEKRRCGVLFCVPGGLTCGHVMRVLAIIRALQSRQGFDGSIFVFSRAKRVGPLEKHVADIVPVPPDGHAPWRTIARWRPSVVVFDCAPDLFPVVREYATYHQLPTAVILRRHTAFALRKLVPSLRTSDHLWVPHQPDPNAFDGYVPELPADLNCRVRHVGDVVPDVSLLARSAARDALGLPPEGRAVLISFGSDRQADFHVENLRPLFAARSDIQFHTFNDALESSTGLDVWPTRFPLAPYLKAFDAAVAACGYNLTRELTLAGVPAVFVPMGRQRDDCHTRLATLERLGVGIGVRHATPAAIDDALSSVLCAHNATSPDAKALIHADGAKNIAEAIESLLRETCATDSMRDHGAAPNLRDYSPSCEFIELRPRRVESAPGYSVYLDWQWPVITEKTAAAEVRDLRPELPGPYFAYPWATLLDTHQVFAKTVAFSAWVDQYLDIPTAQDGTTVCQSIHYQRLFPLLQQIGVGTLFATHASRAAAVLAREEFGLRVLPFHHYPVNAAAPALAKDVLCSFVGTPATSPVRHRMLKLVDVMPEFVVRLRIGWHFGHDVFGVQLGLKQFRLNSIDRLWMQATAAQEYRELLSRSRFAICPEGTGPNTIRLWESLYAGAIPVVLADEIWLPEICDWSDVALFVSTEEVETVPDRIASMSLAEEEDRRERCVELARSLSGRNFIRPILQLSLAAGA